MRKLQSKFTVILLLMFVASAAAAFAIARRPGQGPTPEKIMLTMQDAKPLTLTGAPRIALRHMADERNRREAQYVFQTSPELRPTVERYSFVIENTSDKGIIALSFGYSFPQAGEVNPEMGTLRTSRVQAYLQTPASSVLMPPGMKVGYCMGLGAANFDFKNGIRHIPPTATAPLDPRMPPERQEQAYRALLSRFEGFDRLMGKAHHWEVEIEGAVFEDGTFVGTNRRQYFEQMNASFVGARELADDLLARAAKGVAHADLVAHAKTFVMDFEEMLKPFNRQLDVAMKDTAYLAQFSKMTVANHFVRMSQTDGMKYLQHGQQNWKALRWVK